MNSLYSLWLVIHLLGLALGVGAATVKLALLLKCRAEPGFVPAYLKVTRPITKLIITGLILLTLSGVGWLLTDRYTFGPVLITKIALVVVLWVLGPVIDNVVEPKFRKLAPPPGEPTTPAFVRANRELLVIESVATGAFYAITFLGVAIYP